MELMVLSRDLHGVPQIILNFHASLLLSGSTSPSGFVPGFLGMCSKPVQRLGEICGALERPPGGTIKSVHARDDFAGNSQSAGTNNTKLDGPMV